MERLPVRVWNKTTGDEIETCIILEHQTGYNISITLVDGAEIKATGEDQFKALTVIRAELEKQNYYILCNGSRIDVAPSGMGRQMSDGRKAYVLTMNKQAFLEDLIDIFDFSDKNNIGTIAEQRDYYQKWKKTIEAK